MVASLPKFNPLAIIWSARLRALQSLLHRFPADPNAWRWQIGHRILNYLLIRYADDPTLARPTRPIETLHPNLPPLAPHPGKPPRSRASIAAILTRIAAANADR